MGLGIRAYSHLTYVGHHEEWADEDEHYEKHQEAYAYLAFPHALLGVPDVRKKSGYGEQFLSGGCFEITDKSESHGFRAGSYGGYNNWRADLARLFNTTSPGSHGPGSFTEPDPDKPFYELIWFADNEGTICELAATNLLADFREHEIEYRAAHADEVWGYSIQKYADWMRACELAADGGLIDFH